MKLLFGWHNMTHAAETQAGSESLQALEPPNSVVARQFVTPRDYMTIPTSAPTSNIKCIVQRVCLSLHLIKKTEKQKQNIPRDSFSSDEEGEEKPEQEKFFHCKSYRCSSLCHVTIIWCRDTLERSLFDGSWVGGVMWRFSLENLHSSQAQLEILASNSRSTLYLTTSLIIANLYQARDFFHRFSKQFRSAWVELETVKLNIEVRRQTNKHNTIAGDWSQRQFFSLLLQHLSHLRPIEQYCFCHLRFSSTATHLCDHVRASCLPHESPRL